MLRLELGKLDFPTPLDCSFCKAYVSNSSMMNFMRCPAVHPGNHYEEYEVVCEPCKHKLIRECTRLNIPVIFEDTPTRGVWHFAAGGERTS